MAMGILYVMELTAGIMKSGVNIEHPADKVINACGGWTCLETVYPGIYVLWN